MKPKLVFLLWHVHDYPDGSGTSQFLLGTYSSREMAKKRIENSLQVAGFCDYPDGFRITEHVLDQDGWPDHYLSMQRDMST